MTPFHVPPYIVVPDSNALFSPKPEDLVAASFTEQWKEYLDLTKLRLFIPEVVKGELLFQKYHIASKSTENALKSLGTIASITKKSLPTIRQNDEIRSDITGVFDAWVDSMKAVVIGTPIATIDWSQTIQNALWRVPPFSLPSDNERDSEKGFRDVLILETLKEIWKLNPTENVVLLTNDGLLAQAATAAAGKNEDRYVFPSLKQFGSHLKLLKQEKDEKFVGQVLAAAPAIFYTEGNAECVYNKFNVIDKIQKDFQIIVEGWSDAENAEPASTSPAFSGLGFAALNFYKPSSGEKIFIQATTVDKASEDGLLHWRTRVELARLCVPALATLFQVEKLRLARFDVKWAAHLTGDAQLADVRFEGIEFVGKKYEICNWYTKNQYGFVTLPGTIGESGGQS